MEKEKIVKPAISPDTAKPNPAPTPQEKDALGEEELDKVAGGQTAPRDVATGQATGRRTYKP